MDFYNIKSHLLEDLFSSSWVLDVIIYQDCFFDFFFVQGSISIDKLEWFFYSAQMPFSAPQSASHGT
jgi:hypothetical protein